MNKYLIELKEDLNYSNKHGKTPLFYAKMKNEDMAKYLIENGAFINKKKNREAPLFNA